MSMRRIFLSLLGSVMLVAAGWHTAGAATFTVTSTNDAGMGSLREAVSGANTNQGADVIAFDSDAFPSGLTTSIVLGSNLQLTDTSGGTIIEGDGRVRLTAVSKTFNCIEVHSNDNVIRGLQIVGCWGGIVLDRNFASHANIIGGTVPSQRNVISDNQHVGIAIDGPQSSGNVVIGNYIGLDADGAAALGEQAVGVDIAHGAYSNIVGGTTPGERNVISGNMFVGVSITDTTQEGTRDNYIRGNYIGTDYTGMYPIPNNQGGVGIAFDASGNVIGGSAPGAGNVISGNTGLTPDGIRIGILASGNFVYGNIIGLTADMSAPLPNGFGIYMAGDTNGNRIGGLGPNEANIISGNTEWGLAIGDNSRNNVIEGNYIGTDPSAKALGNRCGLRMGASPEGAAEDNQIGPGNRIWFNTDYGVLLDAVTTYHNRVTQNSITANGEGDSERGILLESGANQSILPPVISVVTETEVMGVADVADGSVVEIFRDEGDQGETYVGSAIVTGKSFVFTGGAPVSGGYLTATVTDTVGNTSEFAVPVPNELVSTDLDVAQLRASKAIRYRGSNTRPVSITLSVSNEGTVEGSVPATVSGVRADNVLVYEETLDVWDDIGGWPSAFPFPDYVPEAAGNITWTVTLDDGDPDIDEATAITRVW